MKKILFFILILFTFVGITKAADCTVVSGTGKEIGDEVKCGTENFYIVERGDNTTKLLAKYNLLVGDTIHYIDADETAPSKRYYLEESIAREYCDNYVTSKGFEYYYTYPMYSYDSETQISSVKGCRIYNKIESEHIRQDSKAIGTFLENGKSKLPLYGIIYMEPRWGYEAIHDGQRHENKFDENGDLILTGTVFKKYLDGYKQELQRQELEVNDVSFITLDTTLSLLKNISGKEITVKMEMPDWSLEYENLEDRYIGKMDIKEYIPDKYKWIYSITYWVGSGFEISDEEATSLGSLVSKTNDYFISNEGILCSLGRGDCGYFQYPIGQGLRPLITVPTTSILNNDYEIEETKPNPETKDIAIILLLVLAITAASIVVVNSKRLKEII